MGQMLLIIGLILIAYILIGCVLNILIYLYMYIKSKIKKR